MKSALIIIDVQKFFINQYTKTIPGKIADFLNTKRDRFDFMVFTKFQNDPNSNWYKIMKWKKMTQNEETELVSDLLPFARQNYFFTKKAAFSIFRIKKFTDFLKKEKIIKLYICGLDTHACVYVSVMEAFERGYEVKLIEDLCAASHGFDFHQNALKAIKHNLSSQIIIKSGEI